jgi:hypothetical protein
MLWSRPSAGVKKSSSLLVLESSEVVEQHPPVASKRTDLTDSRCLDFAGSEELTPLPPATRSRLLVLSRFVDPQSSTPRCVEPLAAPSSILASRDDVNVAGYLISSLIVVSLRSGNASAAWNRIILCAWPTHHLASVPSRKTGA